MTELSLREKRNAAQRQRNHRFLDEGRCPNCHGRNPLAPGKRLCQECSDGYRLYRKYYDSVRRQLHICLKCGGRAAPGIYYCIPCRDAIRANVAKRHQLLKEQKKM